MFRNDYRMIKDFRPVILALCESLIAYCVVVDPSMHSGHARLKINWLTLRHTQRDRLKRFAENNGNSHYDLP